MFRKENRSCPPCLSCLAHGGLQVTRGPRMYSYNTLTEAPHEVAKRALSLLEGIAPEKHTTLVSESRSSRGEFAFLVQNIVHDLTLCVIFGALPLLVSWRFRSYRTPVALCDLCIALLFFVCAALCHEGSRISVVMGAQ